MSITVKIPEGNNPFTCYVGNKKYTYLAGSTQSVPDNVAAVIANINAARQPKRVYTSPETIEAKLNKAVTNLNGAKADKLATPADNYLLQSDANGNAENSGISVSAVATKPIMSEKNLFCADANGGLDDSGIAVSSIPVVITATATAADAVAGTITLTYGESISEMIDKVISFNVVSSDGVVRVVTYREINDNTLILSVTGLAENDVATAYVVIEVAPV